MIKTDTNEDFSAMNGFEILQDNIKENNHGSQNDQVDNNNSEPSKDKGK